MKTLQLVNSPNHHQPPDSIAQPYYYIKPSILFKAPGSISTDSTALKRVNQISLSAQLKLTKSIDISFVLRLTRLCVDMNETSPIHSTVSNT